MVNREINPLREQFICKQARELAIKLWRLIQEQERGRVTALELLPIEPRLVATQLLGLTFEEPDEIGSVARANSMVEVAGLLSRPEKKILVARGSRPEVRRFTGAHEIGHYVLHSEVTELRESPTIDAPTRNPFKPLREKEADMFAAELLMPRKVLREVFSSLFGPTIDHTSLNDDQTFYLTSGKLSASQLALMSPLELAKLVAEESSFISADARCLTHIFGVSAIAMALQLTRLGLVK